MGNSFFCFKTNLAEGLESTLLAAPAKFDNCNNLIGTFLSINCFKTCKNLDKGLGSVLIIKSTGGSLNLRVAFPSTINLTNTPPMLSFTYNFCETNKSNNISIYHLRLHEAHKILSFSKPYT